MKRRIIYVYVFILFLFFCAIVNLYEIQTNPVYSSKAELQQTKNIILSESRGNIYDCNFKNLVGYETKEQYLFFDRFYNFTKLERYGNSNIASHIIGYTDKSGRGISGVEKAFDKELSDYSGKTFLKCYVTARGEELNKGAELCEDNYMSKGGVMLTLDKELQQITDRVLNKHKKKGATVIMDISSGALRAVSSYPMLDRQNLKEGLNSPDKPFVNRAFSSYNVGSVFKLVVAAAALEENLVNQEYFCDGSILCGGEEFSCYDEKAHGKLDMKEALEKSCNTYFVNLSQKLSAEKLIYYAKKFGFGESTYFVGGLYSKSGNLPSLNDLDSESEKAAFSFGQSSLLATPVQIAGLISTIANSGVRQEAYLVEALVDENKNKYSENRVWDGYRVISEKTANILFDYMKGVGENGTGNSGLPEGIEAGVKTATAQTGIIENGRQILQTWYAGFVNGMTPKYAVVVLIEDGISGSKSAAPVFYDIVYAMGQKGYLK